MKKITLLLACISILFISCEGERGPEGPPGADGLLGQVFEVQMDFTAADNYEVLVDFPPSIEVFESDVVVAYILDEIDNGVYIWEPLPQTLFLGTDILLYGFDHTSSDINFFMDGTADLSALDPIYTDDVTMRVAIIPADYAKNIDLTNMEQVMSALQIENVHKIY